LWNREQNKRGMSEELVVVKTFSFRAEADIAQLLLSSAGIESTIKGGDAGGWAPHHAAQGISVLVDAELLEDAKEALKG
jgi:hypothetical protein